ncbi:MAG: T9SS type A sorting domain-containing protein [Candidatus Neomarinimicrobiota bacterium]
MTAASIKLNGTRTGMSNVKLWSSADNSFGGDTQISSTVATDPGTGGTTSFSSFTNAIAASGGTYYFVTVDAASNATGVVQGVLVENASLTITGGTLSGTITNAALSSGDVSLPVELTDFSANYDNGRIVLQWTTASETENLGFILERCSMGASDWATIADYRINSELRGQGSTTQATNYQFIDVAFIPGTEYQYRLSDVDYTGKVTVLGTREARVPPNDIPAQPLEFGLQKAYPNPFNSNIQFTYTIATDDITELTIFDINGRSVVRLVDSYLVTGTYQISWDGTGVSGENIASGVYLAVLKTANKLSQQKVLLIK